MVSDHGLGKGPMVYGVVPSLLKIICFEVFLFLGGNTLGLYFVHTPT